MQLKPATKHSLESSHDPAGNNREPIVLECVIDDEGGGAWNMMPYKLEEEVVEAFFPVSITYIFSLKNHGKKAIGC